MELHQLEQFVAVAEEQHFTRAAQRCHIAQSALSNSIRDLEHDLGAQLFIRTTRRVELTETGRIFLPEARRVLATAAAARDTVEQSLGQVRGPIAIGWVWGDIAPLLGAYRETFPEVEITLKHGLSVPLREDVVRGDLDVAFVGLPTNECPPGVRVVSTRSVPVGIACATGHRLTEHKKVGPKLLKGEVFVADPTDGATHNSVRELFALSGVDYRVAYGASDIPSMLQVIACGLAVALLPKAAVESQPGIEYVPLAGSSPSCLGAVITAERPTNAATSAFLEVLRGPTLR